MWLIGRTGLRPTAHLATFFSTSVLFHVNEAFDEAVVALHQTGRLRFAEFQVPIPHPSLRYLCGNKMCTKFPTLGGFFPT